MCVNKLVLELAQSSLFQWCYCVRWGLYHLFAIICVIFHLLTEKLHAHTKRFCWSWWELISTAYARLDDKWQGKILHSVVLCIFLQLQKNDKEAEDIPAKWRSEEEMAAEADDLRKYFN